MWILEWLPNWIFYAILFLGIIGFLITYLLKFIPIPALYMYKAPIQIVSVLMIVIGVYMAGSIANNESWLAKVKEVEAKLAEAEARGAIETVKIVEKVVVQQKVIKEKGKDIVQYVDREVVKFDNKCEIPPAFVDVHNKAAEKIQ
jgi:uncharacterized membrane protein